MGHFILPLLGLRGSYLLIFFKSLTATPSLGFRVNVASLVVGLRLRLIWEFPKIRGTLFWGPYHKDPTVWSTILGSACNRVRAYR